MNTNKSTLTPKGIDTESLESIAPQFEERLINNVNSAPFPQHVGLKYESVKKDYARMRLPYLPRNNQPEGIIHGGAIATLIDTCVVGAVLSNTKERPSRMVTVDMHIHYLDAGIEEDMIAHAFVRRRGRSMVYLEVDVVGENSGKVCAHGELSYMLNYKQTK